MSGAGCKRFVLRVLASWLLNLLFWTLGSTVVFLLFPIVSSLPFWSGALFGFTVCVIQLIKGESLIKALLQPVPLNVSYLSNLEQNLDCNLNLNSDHIKSLLTKYPQIKFALVKGDCPFIFAFGKESIYLTKNCLDEDFPLIGAVSYLQHKFLGIKGSFVTSCLALPCLMRAFEAVTDNYGKIKYAQGPLWYLGRVFKFLAVFLEIPIRCFWEYNRKEENDFNDYLERSICCYKLLPVWMEVLDILSPCSYKQAKRRAKYNQFFNGFVIPQSEEASHKALSDINNIKPAPKYVTTSLWWLLPISGFIAGLIAAMLPNGPWGAGLLFLGCAMFFNVLLRYPLPLEYAEDSLQNLAKIGSLSYRALPSMINGHIVKTADSIGRFTFTAQTDEGTITLSSCPKIPQSFFTQIPNTATCEPSLNKENHGKLKNENVENKENKENKENEAKNLIYTTTDKGFIYGWLRPDTMEFLPSKISLNNWNKRSFPLFIRLILPLFFILVGSLWWLLQAVSL